MCLSLEVKWRQENIIQYLISWKMENSVNVSCYTFCQFLASVLLDSKPLCSCLHFIRHIQILHKTCFIWRGNISLLLSITALKKRDLVGSILKSIKKCLPLCIHFFISIFSNCLQYFVDKQINITTESAIILWCKMS